MDSRRRTARRALAEHVAMAERLRADPHTVLDHVRGNTERWAASFVSGHRPNWLLEWQQLLTGPLDALIATMTADTDAAARLRATSPFVGLLTEQERLEILRRVDPEMANTLELYDPAYGPPKDAW